VPQWLHTPRWLLLQIVLYLFFGFECYSLIGIYKLECSKRQFSHLEDKTFKLSKKKIRLISNPTSVGSDVNLIFISNQNATSQTKS